MRNRAITEEEKQSFSYKKVSIDVLTSLVDHDNAMRFLFSDQ